MIAFSLIQHYWEYIKSPPVLLAILTIVGPILLEIFKNRRLAQVSTTRKLKGCFRLGALKKSNLQDQFSKRSSDSSNPSVPTVKALFTYPVKSCRGVELAASEVGATGLKYDRLFTFAQLTSKLSKPENSSDGPDVNDVSKDWDHQWRFITQREFPRLALIQTELWVPNPRRQKAAAGTSPTSSVIEENSWSANGGCLILSFPFEPDYNVFGLRTETITIYLPLVPTKKRMEENKYKSESLSIWTDCPQATNITGEIDPDDLAKLKYFLGVSNPLGLFRVDHNNRRAVTRSLPQGMPNESYSVGFADAFPFHLLNLASVRAQDGELPDKSSLKGSLDARRFRANVYVAGSPAYDEDSWKRVSIGRCIKLKSEVHPDGIRSRAKRDDRMVEVDGTYHVACRTARCKLPNVDQETGSKDVNEPSTTLSRTRKVDKGAYPHPCLGMQMIPLFQQGILRVGDEVAILERGEHVYEKMFP